MLTQTLNTSAGDSDGVVGCRGCTDTRQNRNIREIRVSKRIDKQLIRCLSAGFCLSGENMLTHATLRQSGAGSRASLLVYTDTLTSALCSRARCEPCAVNVSSMHVRAFGAETPASGAHRGVLNGYRYSYQRLVSLVSNIGATLVGCLYEEDPFRPAKDAQVITSSGRRSRDIRPSSDQRFGAGISDDQYIPCCGYRPALCCLQSSCTFETLSRQHGVLITIRQL
jgi:hypothetical protein